MLTNHKSKLYTSYKNWDTKISAKTLLNYSLLFVFISRIKSTKNNFKEIILFGLIDVVSLAFNRQFSEVDTRTYIRQNTQCATLEPVLVNHNKVLVPNEASFNIFKTFYTQNVEISDLCIASLKASNISKFMRHKVHSNKLLYLDEAIPRDAKEYLARLDVLNTISELAGTPECSYEVLVRPHPTNIKNEHEYEKYDVDLSRGDFDADLMSAALVVGRQSTALLLSIISGKKTIVCDPADSSFFRNSLQFYNYENSTWILDSRKLKNILTDEKFHIMKNR